MCCGLCAVAGPAWAQLADSAGDSLGGSADGVGAGGVAGSVSSSLSLSQEDDGGWRIGEGLPKWTVRIEPGVSYFGLSGDFTFPGAPAGGSSSEFELQNLNFDAPRLSVMGEVHIARGRDRFIIEGAGFSGSRMFVSPDELTLGPASLSVGDSGSLSIEYETFSMQGVRRVVSRASGLTADGRDRVAFGLDVGGGLRFHRVDANAGAVGAVGSTTRASVNEVFAEPFVTARLKLDVDERFGMEGRFEFGGMGLGDRTSVTGNLVVAFTWRPTPTVGVQTGYRLQGFLLQSGDGADEFEWSGAMAGLFWGVSLSF